MLPELAQAPESQVRPYCQSGSPLYIKRTARHERDFRLDDRIERNGRMEGFATVCELGFE